MEIKGKLTDLSLVGHEQGLSSARVKETNSDKLFILNGPADRLGELSSKINEEVTITVS